MLRPYSHFALRKSRARPLDKRSFQRHEGVMFALLIDDLDACLRFYSRLALPYRAGSGAMPDFSRASYALPLAGALIGACGGAALFIARVAGVAPLPAAACAVAVLVAVTGALHEDGLADLADGFGGGRTRERKLEIMRDSRLGSYGACALGLALILRLTALAAIAQQGLVAATAALIVSGAVSRAAGLLPMVVLAPARADGAGASALRPSRETLLAALAIAAAVSLLASLAGIPLQRAGLADLAALIAAAAVTRLAARQIGGFTGDVLGAAQQAGEVAVLLLLSG